MAHDPKSSASSEPQREHPPASPSPYLPGGPWHAAPVSRKAGGGGPETGAGAEGASKSNPVSWAIEELQADLNLPEPSQPRVPTAAPPLNPFAGASAII